MREERTVLLHSGGMDSTVLLYDLLARGDEVLSLGVDYGQRHRRELESAAYTAHSCGVTREVIDLSSLGRVLLGSALTDPGVDVPHGHYEDESMKATVVPNRNMILIAIAAAAAVGRGWKSVAYAAHAGDHAIYPDCRPEFMRAMFGALALCHYEPVYLLAPYEQKSKRDIGLLGQKLGVDWERTWTCYEGGQFHCGKCGACTERREALEGFDPTEYAAAD